MKWYIIILLVFVVALTSCDPVQTIEIENTSDSEITIKFYFTGNEYPKFDGFLTKDSLILNLAPNEKKFYDLGIGTWEMDNSLDSLTFRVEQIKIESETSTQIFETRSQIRHFFEDRLVDDRYKARIIIELK